MPLGLSHLRPGFPRRQPAAPAPSLNHPDMKTTANPLRPRLYRLALLLGTLAGAFPLLAQTPGTGTIQGRVYNPVTQ
jgi:hypothetical protein